MRVHVTKFYKDGVEYEFKQYFSNIVVGNSTVEANNGTNAFEIAGESGGVVSVAVDNNDVITIDVDKDLSKYDNNTSGFATLASPELSGTPTAPTASAGTNTTLIATTEFVTTAVTTVTNTIGAASGVCPLNSNSKVDSLYLPSYVDDVIEVYARSGLTALSLNWFATNSASGNVVSPETGKIYVLMADSGDYAANTLFRWGGTAYVKLNDGGASAITNSEIDQIINES